MIVEVSVHRFAKVSFMTEPASMVWWLIETAYSQSFGFKTWFLLEKNTIRLPARQVLWPFVR
jgi:hypothetical protein